MQVNILISSLKRTKIRVYFMQKYCYCESWAKRNQNHGILYANVNVTLMWAMDKKIKDQSMYIFI